MADFMFSSLRGSAWLVLSLYGGRDNGLLISMTRVSSAVPAEELILSSAAELTRTDEDGLFPRLAPNTKLSAEDTTGCHLKKNFGWESGGSISAKISFMC